MAEYDVQFLRSAAKELRSLPISIQERVRASVEQLRTVPRPPDVRKLQGFQHLYRIRVGDYRVVYEIDDAARLIRVVRVRHRGQAYS